jgi:hypothetical protein
MSDDTLQRPFSVDYLTKYRMPAGELDSLPNDSDLEEVSCNESKQEVQVNDLFPEIDARYDQTDGVLEKEFYDWQITIDTAHHPRRPDLVVGGIEPVTEDDKSANNDSFEGDFLPENSPTPVPAKQVESRNISAGKSDDSEVPFAVEELGEREMGANENNNTKDDNNDNDKQGAFNDDGTGDATMTGENGKEDGSNGENDEKMEDDGKNSEENGKDNNNNQGYGGNGGDGDDDDDNDDEDDDVDEEEEDEEIDDETKAAEEKAKEADSDEEMEKGAEDSKEELGVQAEEPVAEAQPQAEGDASKGNP